MTRAWRLDTDQQTMVLTAVGSAMAEVIYWGARLADHEDLAGLLAATRMDVTGGMLDQNPSLSICPEASRTFPGQPGLVVSDQNGAPVLPSFRLLADAQTGDDLSLVFRDDVAGLTLTAEFSADQTSGMITARSFLNADQPVRLHWLAAPVLLGSQFSEAMLDFSGRWCGEFQVNETPWSPGIHMRESRTGRTGHEHFPGLIVPESGCTNTRGAAYAFHYGWSGGHRMIAEELPDGRRQIQFGNASGIENEPAKSFETAKLYATYAPDGLNGCAVAFQRHLRERIVTFADKSRPRPVHYNCWEAVYFDHQLPVLKEIAERAADLGAERFVLDDGWFLGRDSDTKSLGDWTVDPQKYPDGLTPLIAHVHHLGMTFGIWFEPEMISLDSDLYRKNPAWLLGPVDQVPGRQQMVLNMALPEVRDYLFDRIGKILSDNAIDYIKWDHNRVLPFADAAQTRGTYELLDRLHATFPGVEIESCASGGGRIDFGVLERTQRVWLSDSNDAIERLRIQHNAALFLPAIVTGSHVGPRQSHTSGRVIGMSMRAWVAAQRHLGFEMDPRELTETEETTLKSVVAWWKSNRGWMMSADILRLDTIDKAVLAEQHLAGDKSRFVVFAGRQDTSAQILPRPLRLTNLDPGARYKVELVNRAEAENLSRAVLPLKDGPLELSGQALMQMGLMLPWSFPATMWVIEGQKL